MQSADHRVVLNTPASPDWSVLHDLWLVPGRSRPRLLVSVGRPRAVARALTRYPGLRPVGARAGRRVLAAVVRAGAQPGLDRISIQRRRASATRMEPIGHLGAVLATDLTVVIGVRTGANAKATLQMFDIEGSPAGYAKFGWDPLTSHYVTTEARALEDLAGGTGSVRTPRVLASGELSGQPYLVSAPLPSGVRRPVPGTTLLPQHLVEIAPLRRHDPIAGTRHFQALGERVRSLDRSTASGLADSALDLHRSLARLAVVLPVAERWHGDLVPWNTAWEGTGILWVWDWESSEDDAVVGLDAYHWLVNKDAPAGRDLPKRLVDATRTARPVFTAFGVGAPATLACASLYALCIAERNLSLAAARGGWQHHRLGQEVIERLLTTGRSLADRARDGGVS